MYLLSTLFFGLFTSLYLVLYAYPFHITSNNRSSYHAWTVSLPVRFRLEFEYNACEDIRGFHKNRELYGRVIQCRTGHAYTGEFRQRFKLEGPYDCPCGEQLETCEHILRECTRFSAYHHILQETSPNILLSDILGTKEGIFALAKFLELSVAFSVGKLQIPLSGRSGPSGIASLTRQPVTVCNRDPDSVKVSVEYPPPQNSDHKKYIYIG